MKNKTFDTISIILASFFFSTLDRRVVSEAEIELDVVLIARTGRGSSLVVSRHGAVFIFFCRNQKNSLKFGRICQKSVKILRFARQNVKI